MESVIQKHDIEGIKEQVSINYQNYLILANKIDILLNDIEKINTYDKINIKRLQTEVKIIKDSLSIGGDSTNTNNNGEIQTQIALISNNISKLQSQLTLNSNNIGELNSQIALILDRINHLEDNSSSIPTVKTYSVTYNLNNVISSNNTTLLTENSSYSTTLTTDDNFTISNVTVTVADVNVTDSVYSNGVINIGNVTGNIVITVTAILNEGDTSIVKCKNGALPSADGLETASTTRIITDFIPVSITGQLTVYSKTTQNYKYLIRYYDTNKNYLGSNSSEWSSDGISANFNSTSGVDFAKVKFLRLLYKSKTNDNEVLTTISGTLEIESDGNIKTLIMEYY